MDIHKYTAATILFGKINYRQDQLRELNENPEKILSDPEILSENEKLAIYANVKARIEAEIASLQREFEKL